MTRINYDSTGTMTYVSRYWWKLAVSVRNSNIIKSITIVSYRMILYRRIDFDGLSKDKRRTMVPYSAIPYGRMRISWFSTYVTI